MQGGFALSLATELVRCMYMHCAPQDAMSAAQPTQHQYDAARPMAQLYVVCFQHQQGCEPMRPVCCRAMMDEFRQVLGEAVAAGAAAAAIVQDHLGAFEAAADKAAIECQMAGLGLQ